MKLDFVYHGEIDFYQNDIWRGEKGDSDRRI